MSHVTDVMLTAVCGADEALEPIQEYLMDTYGNELSEVGDFAGGTKGFQADLWAGAFNYMDIPAFVDKVKSCTFKYPESVQLFIKDEHDDVFKEMFQCK